MWRWREGGGEGEAPNTQEERAEHISKEQQAAQIRVQQQNGIKKSKVRKEERTEKNSTK